MVIEKLGAEKPRLLLHACCAPCSSYVIEYLSKHFAITLFFYNPNIFPPDEYSKRSDELLRMVSEMQIEDVKTVICDYDAKEFQDAVNGFENCSEGGERCFRCYELRLKKAVEYAENNGYDYFTTTLSISPYKNAEKLNEIAERLSQNLSVKALPSDFKKNNGYKRSIELSKEYNLYRQDYCGCVYSKAEREKSRNIE